MSVASTLLVRADASERIGSGHILRCLALAQAWQEDRGRRVVFLSASLSPALEKRLTNEGVQALKLVAQPGTHEDAGETRDLAGKLGVGWVVLDGYQFSAEYQRMMAGGDLFLLCIDDVAELDQYYADIVLNQNIYARADLYEDTARFAQLLLGSEYALLRQEFWMAREFHRDIPQMARKILVTLGGSIDTRMVSSILSGLAKVGSDIEVAVATGTSKGSQISIRGLEEAGKSVRIIENPQNMVDLMKWADIAITAAGSTVWECAAIGLPMIVVVRSNNQERVAEALIKQGIARSLCPDGELNIAQIEKTVSSFLKNASLRYQYSEKSRRLVDGLGASRVVQALTDRSVTLRKANFDDCRQVWVWANDAQVRQASFSTEPILWDDHVKWFSGKISDINTLFFIAENMEGQPVGQVRFDLKDEGDAEIHISLGRRWRGQGFGSVLIKTAINKVTASSGISTVHAMVKVENKRSTTAFFKAGFTRAKQKGVERKTAIHLIYVFAGSAPNRHAGLPR